MIFEITDLDPGVIGSKQKIYQLHRHIYNPFKYLWWNAFAKLPISGI